MNNEDLKSNKKRAKPFSIDSKTLIELLSEAVKERTNVIEPVPTFSKGEMETIIWLLFRKTDEFRVWIIKKRDRRAIRQFIQERETQRQGIPLKASSIYLRRMNFLKELLNSKFNAAEAARRCGYSRKYAKQVAYRIRRSIY